MVKWARRTSFERKPTEDYGVIRFGGGCSLSDREARVTSESFNVYISVHVSKFQLMLYSPAVPAFCRCKATMRQ